MVVHFFCWDVSLINKLAIIITYMVRHVDPQNLVGEIDPTIIGITRIKDITSPDSNQHGLAN